MWMLVGKILLWVVVIVGAAFYGLCLWAMHERNKATLAACNKLLGLPEDTPYSWYEERHRRLHGHATTSKDDSVSEK